MLAVDKRNRDYVINHMISAKVFFKVCEISFSQQVDNFFWSRKIVLCVQILDKNDK